MIDPDYSKIGRTALIAYCETLRNLIKKAGPLTWVMTGDIEGAHAWECEAAESLYVAHEKPET